MNTTRPTEEETLARAEQSLRSALPQSWDFGRTTDQSGTRNIGVDARWRVTAQDGTSAVIDVAVKRQMLGRDIDALARRFAPTQAYVLIASFIGATTRDALAAQDISYADATGNMRITLDRPGLFVQTEGAKRDPWRDDAPLKSLKGAGAARAVRAILDTRPPFGIRELAERRRVPLASLSRTVELLDKEALVTRGDKGQVASVDWTRVIRRWAQDYDFARSNQVRTYLEPRGLGALKEKLADSGLTYAVSGSAGTGRYFGSITTTRVMSIYVAEVDVAVERLGLRTADAGANVAIVKPNTPTVFEGDSLDAEGLRVVAPTQLAVDLLTGAGREPSEGEELLDWMSRNENAWRN